MSKVESSSLPSSSLPTTPLTVLKPINIDVLEPPSTNGDFSRSASVSAVQTPVVANSAPSESNSAALGPNIGLDIESVVKESRKRSQDKGRNGEEVAIIAQTSARWVISLLLPLLGVIG